MRTAARIDGNQQDIVDSLRAIGCTVQILSAVGNGCPDILVGTSNINILMEIKDGEKVPSARKLTKDQVIWHEKWKGQKCVVNTAAEAIRVVNKVRNPTLNLS